MAQAHHPLLEELPDEPAQDPLPEPAAFEPTEPARAVETLAEPVQSAEIDVAAEPEVASNAGEPGEANLSADPEPAPAPDVAHIAAADDLAARIVALHTGGTSGTRTLLTGSDDLFALAREATAVGRSIANKGQTVIMVDWNLSGEGISSRMDQPTW